MRLRAISELFHHLQISCAGRSYFHDFPSCLFRAITVDQPTNQPPPPCIVIFCSWLPGTKRCHGRSKLEVPASFIAGNGRGRTAADGAVDLLGILSRGPGGVAGGWRCTHHITCRSHMAIELEGAGGYHVTCLATRLLFLAQYGK